MCKRGRNARGGDGALGDSFSLYPLHLLRVTAPQCSQAETTDNTTPLLPPSYPPPPSPIVLGSLAYHLIIKTHYSVYYFFFFTEITEKLCPVAEIVHGEGLGERGRLWRGYRCPPEGLIDASRAPIVHIVHKLTKVSKLALQIDKGCV